MTLLDLIINKSGRLRSGWRFSSFVFAFLAIYFLAVSLIGDRYRLTFFCAAVFTGWACGKLFEELPWSALGWAFHRGWFRDLSFGALCGSLSLIFATLLALFDGGFHFSFAPTQSGLALFQTSIYSALYWLIPAAAEEALFRGYPLQTLLRAWPIWIALVPTSLLFASIHLLNPNVVPGVSFVNTALAGMWLAVAYWRTRSLWFPLGLHWAWNWTMGSLLGLPVSGLDRMSQLSLLHATDAGPAWLTGGNYGIEGGAACTVALIISTTFIARTRWLEPARELKSYTERETEKKVMSDK